MTRRPTSTGGPDHSEHRARWTGLIHDIHHAVAASDAASLTALASRANAAEACWTMVAPYPRGLVCKVMARLAWAWSRQTDADLRQELTPLLMASVGMVDRLITETVATPSGVSGRAAGAVIGDDPITSARMPYRED